MVIAEILSLITWFANMTVLIGLGIIDFATGSKEGAIAFSILFMLLFGGLAYNAFQEGTTVENAIFGNVTITEFPAEAFLGNDTIAYILQSELSLINTPDRSTLVSKTAVNLTNLEVRGWRAVNQSGCPSDAANVAQGNHVWSAVLKPSSGGVLGQFITPFTGGNFDEFCGYAEVSESVALNSTAVNDLRNEVTNYIDDNNKTLCEDIVMLHEINAWWAFGAMMTDCYVIRNNVSFERIYFDQPFQDALPGTLILNHLWNPLEDDATILPDTEFIVTKEEVGPLTDVTFVWFSLKALVNEFSFGTQILDPVIDLMTFMESAAVVVAMILITLLTMVILLVVL